MKKILITLLALLTSVHVLPQESDIAGSNTTQSFTLSNGLTVYLHPDNSLPEVFGMIVVKAGAKDDPSDATGMAHYMEHMLFKGTADLGTMNFNAEKPLIDSIFIMYDSLGRTKDESLRRSIQLEINRLSLAANEFAIPNEFSILVKSIGGTGLNAGTGPDQTVYYNTFPPYQLEKWLDIYSHRFINPVFRSFQAELEVVYEEKNLYSDVFFTGLLEEFQKQFFKNHPYGQKSIIGTAEDLKNPSLTKMYEFFKTWYKPSNMALILAGDIEPGEAETLVKKYFERLPAGTSPDHMTYKEEPFKGREYHSGKLSPIRIILLGFRTVPVGHPDELPLSIANELLNNSNSTGLLDQLTLDNEIMGAMAIPLPYLDHGGTVFIGIPKIVGQPMRKAESLMMQQVEKLRRGEFSDTLLNAIKLRLYRENQMQLESNYSYANAIAQSYITGQPLEYFTDYANRVRNITKDDVVEAVNKYYGDDYLVFYSKIGFKPKDKIEKPGYAPIPSRLEAKSAYAQKFDMKKSADPEFRFIDFKRDVMQDNILKHNFYHTPNLVNDIFSLTIKYQVGSHEIPLLEEAAQLMNGAGTGEMGMTQIKKAFEDIGCTYSIFADESFLTISLSGVDAKFKEALYLLMKLMQDPTLDEKKIKVLINGERATRIVERNMPDLVADALFDYVRYKDRSPYLTRPSLKDLKKLTTENALTPFKEALEYKVSYHYVGSLNPDMVKETIKAVLMPTEHPKEAKVPYVIPLEQYEQNTVYFISKKKARQSKVFLYFKGPVYLPQQQFEFDAFNLYYGGDFSGLVLQEIREYRSLAYSAGAGFQTAPLVGKMTQFNGYVGTQSDKTLEALAVYDTLIRFMPEKPERMEFIRPYLIQQLSTSRPGFRNLSMTVEAWQRKGFNEDPGIQKLAEYRELQWSTIKDFYLDNVQNQPVTIAIVGDTRQFDVKELEKYGKVIEVKEKTVFGK